jgi:hypothetical protein
MNKIYLPSAWHYNRSYYLISFKIKLHLIFSAIVIKFIIMKKYPASINKARHFIFPLILLLLLLDCLFVSAQNRPENPPRDRQPAQQRPAQPKRPPLQQRPQQRPPVQRPVPNRPQTRPPVQRPPVQRPAVQRPQPQRPVAHHRPPINYRPPGWGANRPVYTRPPHVFGGRRYYTYHHYYNHPYSPYVYGPSWHPIGFFVRAFAATAIIISFNNTQYHCEDGVYYAPGNDGYVAVAPPIGAFVPSLPNGYATVNVGGMDFYYYGGTFYAQAENGYQIVQAPPGAIVYNLPGGCEQVQSGNILYLKYNNAYYQPIQFNGQNAYEVAEIE